MRKIVIRLPGIAEIKPEQSIWTVQRAVWQKASFSHIWILILQNMGKIDYIHEDEVLIDLAKQEHAIGFILPTIDKSQLFPGILTDGVLPRKTFSMGHACDKRYYLEGRRPCKDKRVIIHHSFIFPVSGRCLNQ